MPNIDPTYIHFLYRTNQGIKTACGVCNRHRCSENISEVNCPRCLRLINETDFLKLIEEEID